MTTLTLVNAIISVGNRVAAAASGSESTSLTGDALEKSIEGLRGLLIPEVAEELDKRTQEVKKKLEEEYSKGPLRIRAQTRAKKGRIVRRRKR